MNVIDCVQGTPEWAAARCGRVTASAISAVLSRSRDRKSEGATRRNYKAQIISEVLTGRPCEDTFTSKPIENGKLLEPDACTAYEVARNVFLESIGFVVHPTIERSGASPDRLIEGQKGLVEVKCPIRATHLGYLLADEVPSEYEPQIQWELACTGYDWADFISYNPDFPRDLQLFIKRVPRDEKRIAEITAEVSVFLREVDQTIAQLSALKKAA